MTAIFADKSAIFFLKMYVNYFLFSIVALSPAKAEYIAANEVKKKPLESTVILYEKNLVFHARSKNIELHHHLIHEMVN